MDISLPRGILTRQNLSWKLFSFIQILEEGTFFEGIDTIKY
jgi:hypothetical protein